MKSKATSRLHALTAALLLALPAAANTPLDARFALVIGNSAYRDIEALSNPGKDAHAVANKLKDLGFQTVEIQDASSQTMLDALKQFEQLISKRDAAVVVYYAGHGIQIDWRNYLLPVDAKVRNADDVRRQSLNVSDILERLKSAKTRTNVVILDACRNNPFASGTSNKGLAPLDAPVGTYFAYATAPGHVASDGEEALGNGLFTHYLLKELQRPAVIEEMFRRVRLGVRRHSEGQQIPWDSSSLEESFAINDGRSPNKASAGASPPASPQAPGDAFDMQKAEWDKVRTSKNVAEVYEYLDKFPVGHITQQALFKLEQLAPAKIQSQPLRDAPSSNAGKPRFRIGDTWTELTIDGYTGRQLQSTQYRVESIENGIATIRSELGTDRRTLDGGMLSVRTGEGQFRFEPARIFMPGDEIVTGKKWYATHMQDGPFGQMKRTENFVVRGFETVRVKAGEFKTWKITSEGFANDVRSEFTYWVLPDFGIPVKWTRTVFRKRGNAMEQYELASLQRAGM